MYQLYAVIVHEGSTLKGGHYYCFIRISPDEWIRFDDAMVKNFGLLSYSCLFDATLFCGVLV